MIVKTMKKFLVMVAVAIMTAMNVQAQIPANIKAVLDRCDEKMDNPTPGKGAPDSLGCPFIYGVLEQTSNILK